MYKLSIAFITYNRSIELIRAIESCKNKGFDDFEIVVWDNHSDEFNQMQINAYIAESGLDIKYEYAVENLGVSGGRNAVWQLCNSQYVLFLDDDAILDSPSFLIDIVTYMDTNIDVGIAGVNIYEPDSKSYINCPYKKYKELNTPDILSYMGGCHVIRKSIIDNDYLYPDSFKYGSEELFLSLLIYDKGFRIVECSNLTALHMPSRINRCKGKDRDENLVINQYVIKLKLFPIYLYPIYTFFYLIRLWYNKMPIINSFSMSSKRSKQIKVSRIKFSTLVRVVKLFGIRVIL